MLFYLSGGIEFSSRFGSEWREEMESFLVGLGHSVFNPIKENPCKDNLVLKVKNDPEFFQSMDCTVLLDIEWVLKSDFVICRASESAIHGSGTHGEITVAKMHRVPIITWIPDNDSIWDLPSWMIGCLVGPDGPKHVYTEKEDLYSALENL